MKKLHKICAVILVLAVLSMVVCINFNAATIFKQDGFLYAYTAGSKADLHGRESDDADLVIPKEFNEHYITNIVDSAFSGDENIQSLSFSKSILLERIGYYAFANCVNLSGTVYIGGRISEVGTSAFQGCSSLESVIYRNNLISVVHDQCFYNCASLSYVELPELLTKIEKFAFANTAIKDITIPKSVTSIDSTAFDGCEGLTIYCYTDSAAHTFAEDNNFDFVLLDAPEPTEPPTETPTEAPSEAPTDAPPEAPTEPSTEAPTVKLGYFLGDANDSGEVESSDGTFIQRWLCEMNIPYSMETLMQGNVDGDNELEISDVTFIQRYLVDMKTPYAIGEWITL